MKQCNVCRQDKEASFFHRRAASRDGLSYTCVECVKISQKKHYLANRDLTKQRSSRWAQENQERRREIRLLSSAKHIDKKRADNAAHNRLKRLVDPISAREAGRRHAAIRRAREAQNGGVVSQEIWDGLFAIFEFKTCLYCGKNDCELVMDHFVPVRHGGRTEVGNLLPCCGQCNASKNAKLPEQWLTPKAYDEISRFLAITAEAAGEACI